jgi:peptide/nickel transport system substrate-binding protein
MPFSGQQKTRAGFVARMTLKIQRHLWYLPAACLIMAAGLFLDPATATATAADPGPALTIGVGRDFFDGPDSRTFLHGSTHTWEGLTYLDDHLTARPWLAEEWHSLDDCRTWVFRLRKDAVFHDGTKLTAGHAKTAILRIARNPRYDPAGVYRNLETLEASGPLELRFNFSKPFPAFPNAVSYYSSPVLHPKGFDENGRIIELIATGPFFPEIIRAGDRIELRAFSGYWGDTPHVDRVVFRTLLDAQTRAMALMSGEIDAVADVGALLPQQADLLKGKQDIVLKQVEVATTHYLIFNCRIPPFHEAGSRHWLAEQIDLPGMIAALVPGAARPARDPYTPLAADWAFHLLSPGPSRASAPDFVTGPLKILIHAGTVQRWPYLDMAQFIQAGLEAHGFRSRIVLREPGAYYQDMRQGDFHVALQPNTLMTGDPDFFFAYYMATDSPRYYGCGSSETDDLIRRARHEPDLSQRKALYRNLSEIFARELPLLPLYHDISYYAHTSRIDHFFLDHNFRPCLTRTRIVK